MAKNFKTITIGGIMNAINTCSIPMFLPFVPNYFIIKYASLYQSSGTGSTSEVLLLQTSLLNNETIYHFCKIGDANTDSYKETGLDIKYKLNPKEIKGNYDFTLINLQGQVPNVIAQSKFQFALTLEFYD